MVNTSSADRAEPCVCGSRSPRPVVMRKDGFEIAQCPDCGNMFDAMRMVFRKPG